VTWYCLTPMQMLALLITVFCIGATLTNVYWHGVFAKMRKDAEWVRDLIRTHKLRSDKP